MKELTEQQAKELRIVANQIYEELGSGYGYNGPKYRAVAIIELEILSLLSKDQPGVGAEEVKRECPECVGRDMPPSGVTKEGEVVDCNTCNGTGYVSYFRAEYRKRRGGGIVPKIRLGNQGFELAEVLEIEGEMPAKKQAEWYVKMFKIAIDKYASQVAAKMARENEELKGRVRELESALRWVLWNAHIPSGLGEERVKEIEELITPKDINGNPLNSKTN